jgi:hypothetical protein
VSRIPSPVAVFRALSLSIALAAVGSGSALGSVQLKRTYVGPVSSNSFCTAEPNSPQYGTAGPAFDPALPASFPGTEDKTGAETGQGFNVPDVTDVHPATAAASHSDLCVGFSLTPDMTGSRAQSTPASPVDQTTEPSTGDDVKRLSIDLPTGYLADVGNAPTCSDAAFGAQYLPATCAANTRVGEAYARATVKLGSARTIFHIAPTTWWNGDTDPFFRTQPGLQGQVFNLGHGPNELGRLGVVLYATNGLTVSKAVVRLILAPDGSGRVRAVTDDIVRSLYTRNSDVPRSDPDYGQPQFDQPAPFYLESLGLKAYGSKADHPNLARDFGQLGTSCAPAAVAQVNAGTYAGTQSSMAGTAFQLAGCDQLAFDPSVSVTTTEHRPDVPTGATITVNLPQAAQGAARETALLKDAAVTLPAGLELGAQAGARDGGLKLCTADQFSASTPLVPNNCPAASAAADVTIASPILDKPFVGKAYLGPQSAVGDLPSLYLEVAQEGATAADAPRIKLVGKVSSDDDGHITTTFLDAPQLRFSQLKLDFPGGPNALFTTPRSCGGTSGTSTLSSWGGQTTTVTSTLEISDDCARPAFDPTVDLNADNERATESSRTHIIVERPDRSDWLRQIDVTLPQGWLADLNIATECPDANAAAGECDASSRIASVHTTVGVGSNPLVLEGGMYLTPREPGAVAGSVIIVRARIGELDLGNVIVPGRIDLRTTDAGLSFHSNVPARVHGLPVDLRRVDVDLDRPGFVQNPGSCEPLTFFATITSDVGDVAIPPSPVQYGHCYDPPFNPSFTASLTGETQPLGHPTVNVTVGMPAGNQHLKRTVVTLPDGVSTDLKNLQVTCSQAQFAAQACPASTRVGDAQANVTITSEVIPADVYLVAVPGQTLPGLGLNFTGRFHQQVIGTVRIVTRSRVQTSFDPVPDLPLSQLALHIAGGASGPIQMSPKKCEANSTWEADLAGYGIKTKAFSIPVPCAFSNVPKPSLTLSTKSGLSLAFTSFSGRILKTAKVTLPKGYTFDTKKAKKAKYRSVKLTGSKSKLKVTPSTLTITATGKATSMKVKLKSGTIKAKTKSKKAKTVKVRIRLAFTDGTSQVLTVSVKVK